MRRFLIILAAIMTIPSICGAQTTKPATQPTITEMPAMELAGIAAFGSAEKGTFAKLWQSWPANVDNQPGLSTTPCYGLALMLPTSEKDHQFLYLACGQVVDAAKAPKHLLHYTLPAGTYAIFKLEGGVPEGLPNIGPMIRYFYHDWLPNSDYEAGGPFNIERYNSKEHTIEMVFPLKKKP